MHTSSTRCSNEVWKSPPSLNRWWVEVSNLGMVRTLDHDSTCIINGNAVTRMEHGRMKKLSKDTRGRFQAFISQDGGARLFLVHRLVAECFVSNPCPTEYDMVFFKNKDITDCRADNLEWGCRKDRDEMTRGVHSSLRLRLKSGDEVFDEVFFGTGELARALGVSRQAVHSAMKRSQLCKGYQIIAEKSDRGGKGRNLNEVRRLRTKNNTFCPLRFSPKHFKRKMVDIRPQAVFK